MQLTHHYDVRVTWEGNRGTGTSHYRAYGRETRVEAAGKPALAGSADPTFHGNAERWNPEELLLAALSQCHLLSYLHAATQHGITVLDYSDDATATMETGTDGGGRFTSATVRPHVTISDPAQIELADSLHEQANRQCFIAASVNFPVHHEPVTVAAPSA